jgi:murein DD-endopeptidase MepM/ murein hydrolase activator NlpD
MSDRNRIIAELKKKDRKNRLCIPLQKTTFSKGKGNRTTSIKQVELFVCLIMLLFSAVLSVKTQNRIQLHIYEEVLKAEGLNYDSFREMLLPESYIDMIKKGENQNAEEHLTLLMLLSQSDKQNERISIKNMNYLLKSIRDTDYFKELKCYYQAILRDIKVFPVAVNDEEKLTVTFGDSWNSYRSYGGKRRHEGTDLMAEDNLRGVHRIISATDGTVEKMGWLEQGGYRIGIRGTEGAYFYYAHLDSYAKNLTVGDKVSAGDFLGFMGDSGYGKEGTVGKFDVHLHFGIYVDTPFGELSVNPYYILLYLNKAK